MGFKTYDKTKLQGVGSPQKFGNVRIKYGMKARRYYGYYDARVSIKDGEEISGQIETRTATEEDVQQLLAWLKGVSTVRDVVIDGYARTKVKEDGDLKKFVSNAPVTYSITGTFRRKLTADERQTILDFEAAEKAKVLAERRKRAEAKKREAARAKREELRELDPQLDELAYALRLLKKNGLRVVVAADKKERLK